ncbi:uncharacterized protein EV422DRAFT_160468 [Fimicolochytrium jonesii]|uniref:uncharacterized protein n=1 Tax=Fimicolochytrium jonesii TaxID=1396493 RepID=UPI0022FF014B|nr:uncharacterized protein EV422DRAFT_160468 [Fimicolochytrium jonesii]KAI8826269.1 hypothetical protein EV422DRAFT_160468 [Fimicolochytrium jonesii]
MLMQESGKDSHDQFKLFGKAIFPNPPADGQEHPYDFWLKTAHSGTTQHAVAVRADLGLSVVAVDLPNSIGNQRRPNTGRSNRRPPIELYNKPPPNKPGAFKITFEDGSRIHSFCALSVHWQTNEKEDTWHDLEFQMVLLAVEHLRVTQGCTTLVGGDFNSDAQNVPVRSAHRTPATATSTLHPVYPHDIPRTHPSLH